MSHSIDSISSFLPDIENCVALVCNGQLEKSKNLHTRMGKCARIIGVDGGINHCHKLKIKPNWIVGDFDSVSPKILKKVSQGMDATNLQRAKDFTDLELAINKVKEVSGESKMVVFAGLGGRIDHTLSNLYLLLRNPGNLFFESDHQLLFGLTADMGTVQIPPSEYKTLYVFPMYGEVSDLVIQNNTFSVSYKKITKEHVPRYAHVSAGSSLKIGKGEVIICLDKRPESPLMQLNDGIISTSFLIEQPLAQVFDTLFHQSKSPADKIILKSPTERVVNIKPKSHVTTFEVEIGQTVSLIPFYGPAKDIKTEGLKWELGPKTVSTLDKGFVGTSNVCLQKKISVKVGSGELLAIFTSVKE